MIEWLSFSLHTCGTFGKEVTSQSLSEGNKNVENIPVSTAVFIKIIVLSTHFGPYLCHIMLILDLFRKNVRNTVPLYCEFGTEMKGICFNILSHHITGKNGVSYEKSRGEMAKQVCQLMNLDVIL